MALSKSVSLRCFQNDLLLVLKDFHQADLHNQLVNRSTATWIYARFVQYLVLIGVIWLGQGPLVLWLFTSR